jgi:hypothetical protein
MNMDLIFQIFFGLITIASIIITIVIANKKERDENREILRRLGLRLGIANEGLKKENEELLKEIDKLSTANNYIGKYRDEQYNKFLNATTNGNEICEAHIKLDKDREQFYKDLQVNNNKIMELVKKIRDNDETIEKNRGIS